MLNNFKERNKAMKIQKEKLTKENVVDAYKNLFYYMGRDNNFSGYNDTIDTFNLCSEYGFELNNSTIDKIELTLNNRVYFYYNQNTNDLDPIEAFSFKDLKSFYNNLVDAWNEEEENDYMENTD